MHAPGEGLMLDRAFYALGYAFGAAESVAEGIAETAADPSAPDGSGDAEAAPELSMTALGAAAGTAAAAWLLPRLLRPRRVRWPRAVAAGLVGTALADLVAAVLDPEHAPFPPAPEDLPHYAAGVAKAAAYAAVVYPRLPGSPLTRGLLFAALDVAAARSGGALGAVRRAAPAIRFPLGALAPAGPHPAGPAAALAYGAGLGLYRGAPRK